MSIWSVLLRRFGFLRLEPLGERPADGDADHHPDSGLLGEQRAHGGQARRLVRGGRGLEHLGLMRLAEPASGAERLGEDPLEPGSDAGDLALGLLEDLGIGDRADGGVDLLVGVALRRHPGNIPRRARGQTVLSPCGAPTSAARRSPDSRASHRRGSPAWWPGAWWCAGPARRRPPAPARRAALRRLAPAPREEPRRRSV